MPDPATPDPVTTAERLALTLVALSLAVQAQGAVPVSIARRVHQDERADWWVFLRTEPSEEGESSLHTLTLVRGGPEDDDATDWTVQTTRDEPSLAVLEEVARRMGRSEPVRTLVEAGHLPPGFLA